jgi:hypothetical protein
MESEPFCTDAASDAHDLSTSWLVSQRRTACLQLEALSTRAGRYRTARVAQLRERVRRIDIELARRARV